MKRILSVLVAGVLVLVFAGVSSSIDLDKSTEMMKEVDEGKAKVTEKEGKASEVIKKKDSEKKGLTDKKDKVKKKYKQKKQKAKDIKESKATPTEKITETTVEGEKGMQEMKDMKKEMKDEMK